MPATAQHTCPTCQTDFEPRRSDQRYCTTRCKGAARRMPPVAPRRCATCSASFEPYRRNQRWCTRACKDVHYGAQFRANGGTARLSPEARERQRLYWQAKNRRRRAAKRGGVSEPYTLASIAERDRFRCQLCGGRVAMKQAVPHAKAPTIDHVVPLLDGGDDTRANVQLAHFRCNSVKGPRGSQQLALVG